MPSLIHAHVLLKHAWFALRLSKKYDIPLLASEQWTGYLPEASGEFETLSSFQESVMRRVFARAAHVTTVSAYLAEKIRDRFAFGDFTVIPNLVDTSVFTPINRTTSGTPTFIHVSTLSRQKNIDELLAACRILAGDGQDFQLVVVGPEHRSYRQQVMDAGLADHVVFKHEVAQHELAKMVAASDALLLYSNYETFGCVIVEANACGVPVIVSDHPVFSENVEDGVTGFRVPLHDPAALAACMKKIINKANHFDKDRIIAITQQRYSLEVVGKQFAEVYQRWAKP